MSTKEKKLYRCRKCQIELSERSYFHLNRQGKKKPQILCIGCNSYERGNEHLRNSDDVKEFYKRFRPYYFNKKRDLFTEKAEGKTRVQKIRNLLKSIKPREIPLGEFINNFENLIRISKKQLKREKSKFRDFKSMSQGLIMTHFLGGWNTFGILPTSAGKSLCFTAVAEAIEKEGITIVISPLISLMKDMKKRFRRCEYFNSSLDDIERKKVIRKIRNRKLSLLLISPERLKSDSFNKLLHETKIARIVIDEAHCITEWGYDFRINYLRIIDFIKSYNLKHEKSIPILLLTATATKKTVQKILSSLELNPNSVVLILPESDSFLRNELNYKMKKFNDDRKKITFLKKSISKRKFRKGIIFSLFANRGENVDSFDTESIAKELSNLKGIEVRAYHGKLTIEKREEIQKWFSSPSLGRRKILIATSSFGMGVNIKDIDIAYHFYPPQTIESYWQQTGRIGRERRNNKKYDCILLYTKGDFDKVERLTRVTSLPKILMILVAIVDGKIIIPYGIHKNKNFNLFIDDLIRTKILRKKTGLKTILGERYMVYYIKKKINSIHLSKMWKIVSSYPSSFNGYRYKRITSLIELYTRRTITDGKLLIRVPQPKGKNPRLQSINSILKDLNVLLETKIVEMETTTIIRGISHNQFIFINSDIRKSYMKIKNWINERREDVQEAKRFVSDMLRKHNLQKFVNNYWYKELSKLRDNHKEY